MAGQTQRVEFMKDIPDDQDRRFAMFSNCFLGKGPATKSDEFLEKFQKGGGSFSIQKFILQNLDL